MDGDAVRKVADELWAAGDHERADRLHNAAAQPPPEVLRSQGEADELARRDLEEFPPGSPQWALRAARNALDPDRRPSYVAVPWTLLEALTGHLDELHGPPFVAFRCDVCGNVVTDAQVRRVLHDTQGESIWRAVLRARPYGEPGDRLEPDWVECRACDHGVMRRVLCRVTADDPATLLRGDPGGGDSGVG